MFKRLFKNKKAQNTAEYALLIALVVAAVIAMQTYAQRAIQARIRGATIYMHNATNELGNAQQYEAYYQSSEYDIDSTKSDIIVENENGRTQQLSDRRQRVGNAFVTYNATGTINGI